MAELAENAILQVRGLKKHFPVRRGLLQRQTGWVKAVDGVDFTLEQGKILGLVGESGCGKTTTGRMILRALDPTDGEIFFRQQSGQVVGSALGGVGAASPAPACQQSIVHAAVQAAAKLRGQAAFQAFQLRAPVLHTQKSAPAAAPVP